MPDCLDVCVSVETLVVAPVDLAPGKAATLTVCVLMGRSGYPAREIREVLAALGLLDTAPGRGDRHGVRQRG